MHVGNLVIPPRSEGGIAVWRLQLFGPVPDQFETSKGESYRSVLACGCAIPICVGGVLSVVSCTR